MFDQFLSDFGPYLLLGIALIAALKVLPRKKSGSNYSNPPSGFGQGVNNGTGGTRRRNVRTSKRGKIEYDN